MERPIETVWISAPDRFDCEICNLTAHQLIELVRFAIPVDQFGVDWDRVSGYVASTLALTELASSKIIAMTRDLGLSPNQRCCVFGDGEGSTALITGVASLPELFDYLASNSAEGLCVLGDDWIIQYKMIGSMTGARCTPGLLRGVIHAE